MRGDDNAKYWYYFIICARFLSAPIVGRITDTSKQVRTVCDLIMFEGDLPGSFPLAIQFQILSRP
jgi:hypothetical protein